MSEKAPKSTNQDKQRLGANLSQKAYLDYSRHLQVDVRQNRHPQAQAEVEKVFGSADGEGKYKDAVIFGHESVKESIDRSYIDPLQQGIWVKPEHAADRYMFENNNLLPALRSGDIEREFHTERLAQVDRQLADIALGVKEGTRWERFKQALSGSSEKLSPVMLDREKAFSQRRIEMLPTEEESQAMARDFYTRNEDFIRADAFHENARREKAKAKADAETEK